MGGNYFEARVSTAVQDICLVIPSGTPTLVSLVPEFLCLTRSHTNGYTHGYTHGYRSHPFSPSFFPSLFDQPDRAYPVRSFFSILPSIHHHLHSFLPIHPHREHLFRS
ncbi:hypothetical protein [Phaffia rhodozyma]|uniref:Uncharacterized protein n=1 Tax=Phaffia rhodozyma TaxID=264483 RepID=A0A0F7SH26_PHARH|nr:hypothetical protein [Phaffia rhodozyma]